MSSDVDASVASQTEEDKKSAEKAAEKAAAEADYELLSDLTYAIRGYSAACVAEAEAIIRKQDAQGKIDLAYAKLKNRLSKSRLL